MHTNINKQIFFIQTELIDEIVSKLLIAKQMVKSQLHHTRIEYIFVHNHDSGVARSYIYIIVLSPANSLLLAADPGHPFRVNPKTVT